MFILFLLQFDGKSHLFKQKLCFLVKSMTLSSIQTECFIAEPKHNNNQIIRNSEFRIKNISRYILIPQDSQGEMIYGLLHLL